MPQGVRRKRLESIGQPRLGLIEERELFGRRLAFLFELRLQGRNPRRGLRLPFAGGP